VTWVKVAFGLFFICAASIGGSKAIYRFQTNPDSRWWMVEAALSFATFVAGLVLVIVAFAHLRGQ
jgi:hypothetical protein